jgi:hypothetical protein
MLASGSRVSGASTGRPYPRNDPFPQDEETMASSRVRSDSKDMKACNCSYEPCSRKGYCCELTTPLEGMIYATSSGSVDTNSERDISAAPNSRGSTRRGRGPADVRCS